MLNWQILFPNVDIWRMAFHTAQYRPKRGVAHALKAWRSHVQGGLHQGHLVSKWIVLVQEERVVILVLVCIPCAIKLHLQVLVHLGLLWNPFVLSWLLNDVSEWRQRNIIEVSLVFRQLRHYLYILLLAHIVCEGHLHFILWKLVFCKNLKRRLLLSSLILVEILNLQLLIRVKHATRVRNNLNKYI